VYFYYILPYFHQPTFSNFKAEMASDPEQPPLSSLSQVHFFILCSTATCLTCFLNLSFIYLVALALFELVGF